MQTVVDQLKPAFYIESAEVRDNGVHIHWQDGHESLYHPLWLRDSCRCPVCFQRDTLSINSGHDPITNPLTPTPRAVTLQDDGHLHIAWDGDMPEHHSVFDASWLRVHCRDDTVLKERRSPQLWDASVHFPHFDFEAVMQDDDVLLQWLDAMLDVGAVLIDGMPKDQAHFVALAERIGPIQERYHPTHVFTLDTANTLASAVHHAYQYMQRLENHTDHVSYDMPPRLQFLGCLHYQNPDHDHQAYSTLADGFNIAAVMRQQHPRYYDLLTQEYVPTGRRRLVVEEKISEKERGTHKYEWERHDRHRIINLDENGCVYQIRHHDRDRVPLDVPPDKIEDLYAAYQTFIKLAESPDYSAEFLIEPGQVLVNDNWRVMHGRTAIRNPDIQRIVLGAYMKPETFRSRRRILLGKKSGLTDLWLMGCSDRALEILAERQTA